GPHAGGEGLGRARRPAGGGRARPALHRPAPRARGHQPAGLRRAAARRAPGAPARPHARHRGPQRPHRRRRRRGPAGHRRPGQPYAGRDAAPQLRGVRRAPAADGRRRAGHRPRHRPAARRHAAGHHDRVRRQPHQHARRVRGAGLRHRHERGRARPGHPDAPAGASPHHGGDRDRTAPAGDVGQGPRARAHRAGRHRRRPGLPRGVPRRGGRGAVDGGPHDGLQHEHRVGRPRRHGRAGRHHVRLPAGPPARAAGRRLGRRRRALGDPAHRRRRGVRQGGRARRQRGHAVRHLGHQPGAGRAARRQRARPAVPAGGQRARRRRARAGVHGARGRDADARGGRRHRLPRLVHERPDGGPAGRRGRRAGAARRRRGAGDGRPGLDAREAAGRAGGPGPGVPRRRVRLAQRRLLDVPRHEPGHARARRAQRVDVEPQLRGPAGPRRPHAPRESRGRRRHRAHRPPHRARRPAGGL
ncbi:MAG: 3-isopropylmalate dehydratase large subunit, partial [uncultured Thermomicrobiales bacterium]